MTHEEKVIELATFKASKARGGRKKALQPGGRPWHEEVSEIWSAMTLYEKSWYIIFVSANFYHDWNALRLLTQSEEHFTHVYTKIYQANNAYRADVTYITYDKWLAQITKLKEINELRKIHPARVQSPHYTRSDIPDDLARLGDSDTPPHPSRVYVTTPSYDKPTSTPVKSISRDEYLTTRRTAPRLGVRLEFDKESIQVYNRTTDKDESTPDWYKHPKD